MVEYLEKLTELINVTIDKLGIYSPIFACFLIVIESILPFLPLSVFITLNFMSFGHLFGFFISWFFTIIGCMISFTLFRKGIYKHFKRLTYSKEKVNKLMKRITNISFTTLVLIISMPFTPAFLLNIAAGLSDMKVKKYLYAIMLGKVALVYFWGYVGTNIIDALNNPINLLKNIIILLVMYIISYIINKKFEL